MRIKLKKSIAMLLACLVAISLLPVCAFADDGIPELPVFDLPCELETVKVGLCVGSAAVPEAELQSSGGFSLGFFDFSRNFHKLGAIDNESITLRGDVGFTVEDVKSGAWHVKLNNSYGSFSDAKAAAASVGGFPAYIDYKYSVLVGAYDSADEANAAGCGGSAYSGSGNSILISESGTDKLLFLYDCGGRNLAISPAGVTSFAGNSYHGDFRFSRKGDYVCVANYVGLEDYVKGVLPYEVSADWPEEAIKSQAVCARTYAINSINGYSAYDIDVRNDTYSQVYKGCSYSDGIIEAAADDTAGKYVRYNGAVCKVYYMSSDGGGTEDGINVFGERRSYLRAVADTFEVASDFYGKTWSEEFTPWQLTGKLNSHGYDIGEVTDVKVTYSDMGNVIRIDFADADGKTAYIERLDCYSVLGLNSIRYDVLTEESDDGDVTYVFEGCGWGHNCGMSQWGACSMAKNTNVSCDDIISFYFSGAYIA